MSEKLFLSHSQCAAAAAKVAQAINAASHGERVMLYAVPRGGVPAAYLVAPLCGGVVTNTVEHADYAIDDLVDSGHTKAEFEEQHPDIPFLTLFKKGSHPSVVAPPSTWLDADSWAVFPWERVDGEDDDSIVATLTNRFRAEGIPFVANDNIAAHVTDVELALVEAEVAKASERLLRALLIDIDNCHNSKDTARRMAKLYVREIFTGRFTACPPITDFPNVKNLDEMMVTGPITVRSTCSHHMCPILGRAWVGIIPGERLIGLSKFNRVVRWLCARPQIQEELVVQVADELERLTKPLGLFVVMEATHTCMTWRGVQEHTDAKMSTSVVRGRFKDNPATRAEFLSLINRGGA